jgi:hypothetical protein
MNRSEVVVRVVLMPADQQTSVRLDPVEPVVLVWLPSLQLKPDLDARGRHSVLVVIEELSWVYFSDDPVWAGFTRFSTSPPNVFELTTELVMDVVVEPLALQVCPVSEGDGHQASVE